MNLSVVAIIMYGVTKASDMAEHAQTPHLQLRNESLQDFMNVKAFNFKLVKFLNSV